MKKCLAKQTRQDEELRDRKCLAKQFLRVDGDEGPVIQLDRVAVATAAALRGVPSRPAD